MKIIVLSDTHISERAEDLPQQVYLDLKKADLVLHAGDIASIRFLEKLQKISEVKAVFGNMDDLELKKILPQKQIITIGKFSIGLIHGWGMPQALIELVQKEFLAQKPDIIVFGHSHQSLCLRKNDILLFNPGSPTDKVFTNFNSYGIIKINDNIEAEIIKIN